MNGLCISIGDPKKAISVDPCFLVSDAFYKSAFFSLYVVLLYDYDHMQ